MSVQRSAGCYQPVSEMLDNARTTEQLLGLQPLGPAGSATSMESAFNL